MGLVHALVWKTKNFSISSGTYSIHDFNAKIKLAILQEKQD